jgi:hypothetical protein
MKQARLPGSVDGFDRIQSDSAATAAYCSIGGNCRRQRVPGNTIQARLSVACDFPIKRVPSKCSTKFTMCRAALVLRGDGATSWLMRTRHIGLRTAAWTLGPLRRFTIQDDNPAGLLQALMNCVLLRRHRNL